MNTVALDSKEQILAAFQQLLAQKKKIDSKIATKEEEAEKAKSKQLLETASTYTIDSIVKGLADLQLDVGSIVVGLSEKLTAEAKKLDEIKRGIEIETVHLQELKEIRIVADALYILNQEHQEKIRLLEQDADSQREIIEKDKNEKRKAWQKEQAEFEISVREQAESLAKERKLEQEEHQYLLERTRKIETDEYEGKKRKLELEIAEANQEKGKVWAEREKILQDNQKLFEENQKKVEAFPAELEEAVKKAREEAIKEATNEAKYKAELVEKEWEGNKQGYEQKVQSLEATIERQTQQITDLSAQLQAAIQQAQALATRAFAGN
jgi:hypothetical protein